VFARSAQQKAAENADQIESLAVNQTAAPLVSCLDDDRIAYDDLSEEYDAAANPIGNAPWAELDAAGESAIGEASEEIERRETLLGEHYPFQLSTDRRTLRFVAERSSSDVYQFCLALSSSRLSLTSNPGCNAVREFERLVGRLLKAFLHGECSEWYRSGAPPLADRPGTFSEMLNDLSVRTGEWHFKPPEGAIAQPEQGDEGVDLVVWKTFGKLDRRIGKPFLLAQCACGRDQSYWLGKVRDLDTRRIEKVWKGTISYADSIRCLAVPQHIGHDSVWHEGTCGAGILLDRSRLTWLVETCLNAEERKNLNQTLAPHIGSLTERG
jgi:hypothetical protein